MLDDGETELLGCVYIDPPEADDDGGAVVSWWVIDAEVDGELEAALDDAVPRWLTEVWGFEGFAVDPPPPSDAGSGSFLTTTRPRTARMRRCDFD